MSGVRTIRFRGVVAGFIAIALVAVARREAHAQLSEDQLVAAVSAAVVGTHDRAVKGATGVEFADSLHVSAAAAERIREAVGAVPASAGAARVCAAGMGPSGCHLRGVKTLIQVKEISESSDGARVGLVFLNETSSTRQPVYGQGVEVALVWEGARWRVTKVTSLWVS